MVWQVTQMKPGVWIELNQHLCLCWTSWELVCANVDAFRDCYQGRVGERGKEGGGEAERESVREVALCAHLYTFP